MGIFVSHTKLLQLSGHLADSSQDLKIASEVVRKCRLMTEDLQLDNERLKNENRDLLKQIQELKKTNQ